MAVLFEMIAKKKIEKTRGWTVKHITSEETEILKWR